MLRDRMILALIRLMSFFPLRVVHAAGDFLGMMMSWLPVRAKRIAARNIQICYQELDERERNTLLRKTMAETAKTALEMGAMWFWPENRLTALVTKVTGKPFLDDAIASGKGVILAAPHLGAWELIGVYCGHRFPMTSLYRPPRLKGLDSAMKSARQRTGATLVPTNASGVKQLFRALSSGEMVAILPDQEPKGGAGVFAPFFSMPAYTMVLLNRLAKKTGAPVLFAFARRLEHGRGFHLHFQMAPESIADSDPEAAATSLNSGVENCIRECPEQYQWSYKRFRTQENGQLTRY